MDCGIVEAPRKALRATFVCTAVLTTVENTGSQSTGAPNRTIEAHLCHKLYIFCTYISVKYVF